MLSGNESRWSIGMGVIVQCPKCSVRLQLPPSSQGGVCPRCRTPFLPAPAPAAPPALPKSQQVPATSATAARPAALVASSGAPATPSATNLGFVAYVRQHFAATHWPAAFGISCGLLSIPVVSFLKPVLGFRGMCFVLAGALALSSVSGVVYVLQRFTAYFLRRGRTVPAEASSWTAPLVYGGWMFLIPMAPCVAAECFTPPYGLLAAIAPELRKEQSRWLRLPMAEGGQHDSGSAASGRPQVEKTEEVSRTPGSPQPPVESENPFVVVEDAPPSKQMPEAKSANITLRNVDGQSLYGSIVTQMAAEKDAAALIAKALEGFPDNYLDAHVVGEPKVLERSDSGATLLATVRFTPNLTAYNAFATRLCQTLDRVAKQKGEFSTVFARETLRVSTASGLTEDGFGTEIGFAAPPWGADFDNVGQWMPKLIKKNRQYSSLSSSKFG